MAEDPIARYHGTLTGTVAIVTGAGSGIGRAIAEAIARSGGNVALVGRRVERLEEVAAEVRSSGGRALVAPADVGDARAVEQMIERVDRELGSPTIAVAAAGVNAWADLADLTPEALRDALVTNLEGVANLARVAIPRMLSIGRGRIIVIASDNGRRPEAGGSGYVASKFGALGFALSLSQELYPSPVSVNIIEPGCVDTEWYPVCEDAPRKRMLQPEDVALIALFLATLPPHIVIEEVMALPRGLLVEPWE